MLNWWACMFCELYNNDGTHRNAYTYCWIEWMNVYYSLYSMIVMWLGSMIPINYKYHTNYIPMESAIAIGYVKCLSAVVPTDQYNILLFFMSIRSYRSLFSFRLPPSLPPFLLPSFLHTWRLGVGVVRGRSSKTIKRQIKDVMSALYSCKSCVLDLDDDSSWT